MLFAPSLSKSDVWVKVPLFYVSLFLVVFLDFVNYADLTFILRWLG